ncbi:hypothetical protein ASD38_16300 [Caulobacter sp. Root487D2Y]|uniref:hypothetical protein n=1 Tax=Caulobacter sp. Root487D2Y TaxID=1736547 RepID=UPI0006F4740F|nr:hypothetical protein [Caulobacter sp. Root487D2Y]KQY28251.1 hypothetical protein ASD38_16300 [Caulobacter sp. Root487D2Y]
MMFKSVLGVATAAVLAGALAPTMASAQSYGGYGSAGAYGGGYQSNGPYYDPCQRSTTQRGTGGGLVGAGLGAAIGTSVAAHGARTEGAVLGGLLGAIAGSAIGRHSAACSSVPPPPPPAYDRGASNSYDHSDYDRGDSYDRAAGYDRTDYDRSYAGRSDNSRDDDSDDGDRPGGYGPEARAVYGVSDSKTEAGGCTLAESPIYLPDGRTQKRFVRVCPDASGRYQVVE